MQYRYTARKDNTVKGSVSKEWDRTFCLYSFRRILFLVFATAIATATAAMTAAFCSIRTSNALNAFFLRLANVEQCRTDNHQNNCNYYIINNLHRQSLPTHCVLFLHHLVSVVAQVNQYRYKAQHKQQTTSKARTQTAGSNQCADLIHQITDSVASSQL